MNRTDRLLAYLVIFQSRSLVRAQDLAERFEISERTVYRDIDALCEVGVPIYGVAGEGYRLMDGYYLPPVTFTPEEARSLALSLSMLMGFTVEGKTRDSAETARDKIQAILPERLKHEVAALQAVVNFYAFPQPQIDFDDGQFLDFQRAIREQKLMRLNYFSLGGEESTTRVVEPMNLVLLNRTWLLSAYCRLRKDHRHFNLSRVDRYELLEETFEPRTAPQQRFPDEQFEIEVLFDHKVVRWVREQQHYSFVRDEADSAEGVTMIYKVSMWHNIANWLLGWGDQMQIMAPHHLREQVAQMARRMSERHQSS